MVLFHPGTRLAMKNCFCCVHPLNLWSNTLHWHYTWISRSYRLFNKNEGTDLYIIQRTLQDVRWNSWLNIAVNSCQIELAQKHIILLLNDSIILYKAGKRTDVENNKFMHSNLLASTYSIDDFNAKIKVAVLQKIQDWELPQINEPKLVIPEDYTFMASNTIFIALGIPNNYLEKTTLIRTTLPPGSYKTSLGTSSPPKSLSLHCKQITKFKNELDGQPSSLLA